ncbi:hypothetical protein BKA70DRAFT_1277239 [Coprinopsis sp. MPI-PUGE-AT-0042]|nr:hypothetical protein BKA70DRAFT_1277239 [Coprinopsis sp. MPI-PUGE-AT-0042]
MRKLTISALSIPQPANRLLIHNLTPDTHTPSPTASGRADELASSLRHATFSHVTPLPLPFPYEIEPPSPSDDPKSVDKNAYVEKWLSEREARDPSPLPTHFPNAPLRKYYGKNRDQPVELTGLSEYALRDCLPHLDVGDAFSLLGVPALSESFDGEGDGKPSENEEAVEARKDLIDVLSGTATLMSPPEATEGGFAPWALRYSGHQFGSWAGQLGDGRAISILVTPHPSDPDLAYELQLKGSGRTPFSRSADGLAVVRSSIREYLCSEAMYALGIPTTRALSIVSLPALEVRLRILGEWVVKNVLRLPVEEGKPWGKELVLDVARRNAKMVAGWQAYGFMHGVMNTDNISIMGLTIDYGPYAFMDVFDSLHICNHSDEGGRYAYKHQPNMILYALNALLDALAPLVGAELESGKAVSAEWGKDASNEQIKEWSEKGKAEVRKDMEAAFSEVYREEYAKAMGKRLGLRRTDPADESRIFKPLLDIMETHKLDFHMTFRILSSFKPSTVLNAQKEGKPTAQTLEPDVDAFISHLLTATPEAERLDTDAAKRQWAGFLQTYAERIQSEHGASELGWPEDLSKFEEQRRKDMKAANPRFILRQWLLEEVIKAVERDHDTGKRVLAKVLQMACNPFEPWGGEEADSQEELSKEDNEEKRYCGLGDKKMLGFQCSCSS